MKRTCVKILQDYSIYLLRHFNSNHTFSMFAGRAFLSLFILFNVNFISSTQKVALTILQSTFITLFGLGYVIIFLFDFSLIPTTHQKYVSLLLIKVVYFIIIITVAVLLFFSFVSSFLL